MGPEARPAAGLSTGISVPFLAGLLDRFGEIVGAGAGGATLHFAAVQQGKALGQDARSESVDRLLARAGKEIGLPVEAHVHGDDVTVQIALDGQVGPMLEAILVGFYEGVLHARTGVPHEGSMEDGGGRVTLRIRRRHGR